MILSLTPNSTLDLNISVPRLVTNTTIRASRTYHSMGGKPTDAAWILGRMGVGSLALGFAAGAIGEKVTSMLEALGVTTDFIEVDGETRVNAIIMDESTGEHTTITTASMSVRAAHLAALRERYIEALPSASVVITGGSLPPGMTPDFYTDAIELARAQDLPVVFDAAEPNLSAGLAARPTVIKPNEHELSGLVGRKLTSEADLYEAGREILARYGSQAVITMGKDGALALLTERSYRIPPIAVEVSSPAGAGDAVLAGLAHALHHGNSLEEGLRLGIAAATAVCLHPGTAAYDVADMERFLPQVELVSYP
ncbi:MAG: 1-phosphofructokinase family hexose kinase [Chloroflexota bacterium]|nr:1-phosphofructokinase family hexose kinase [Chloroflexota bacterium]